MGFAVAVDDEAEQYNSPCPICGSDYKVIKMNDVEPMRVRYTCTECDWGYIE